MEKLGSVVKLDGERKQGIMNWEYEVKRNDKGLGMALEKRERFSTWVS